MTDDKPPESVFTEIFQQNHWKGSVPSGPGSSLGATALIRKRLAKLFSELSIKTLCDAPCGDGTWIFSIEHQFDTYIGIDVVKEVVERSRQKNSGRSRFFLSGDISDMILPRVDAIFCRDCLVHMPLEMAQKTIANFQASGSTYLITTTFPAKEKNIQARLGTWRPLNLEAAPFEFSKPEYLIAERDHNPGDKHNDKSLGVWRLSDLTGKGL